MLIKNIILTLTILGISSVSNAQNLTALDENNGFQNYKFGMLKNNFERCEFQEDDSFTNRGAVICNIERNHIVGDLTFKGVTLYFINSELKKIRVSSNNYNGSKVTSAIESAFSSPTSRNSHNQIGTVRSVCWEANEVTLCHQFAASISGAGQGYMIKNSYYLEFYVNNYNDLLKEFNSKKYTPDDF